MRLKHPGDLNAFHCQKTEMLMISLCISISYRCRVTVTVYGSGLIELDEIAVHKDRTEIISTKIGCVR